MSTYRSLKRRAQSRNRSTFRNDKSENSNKRRRQTEKHDEDNSERFYDSGENLNKRCRQIESGSQSFWRNKNDDDQSKQKKSNDNNIEKSYEPKSNRIKLMTFTRMKQLLTEDPNKICIVLQNKDDGFLTLLENDHHMIKDDWVILIIKLLEQVISSTIDMKRVIIIHACHHFLPVLIKYLQNLPFQSQLEHDRNKYYWQNIESFWSALIKLCNEIIMVIPKTAIDNIPKLLAVMDMVVTKFNDTPETFLKKSIIDDVYEINEKLKTLISERETEIVNEEESNENEMPFGDYKDIPIMPQQYDLVAIKGPEIRANIINGKYISVNHYLDIQFRLLREDFVAPLRNGIQNYLLPDPNIKKKFDTIRIYKNVRIMRTTITKNQELCFLIQLNLPQRQLERLRHSKRLIYGSLLVFTNNFFQTIIVGTMLDKDEKNLKNNEILVDIPLNSVDMEKCFDLDYIMVESEIYFEPYRHVLKTLQQITEESFPMPNYILKADVISKPPVYLTEECILKIDGNSCKILNEKDWEMLTPEKLKYDATQYDAFKAALSKEFCVIQGPPGTGKTFIGLEIIKTLIFNNNLWYKDGDINSGPIMVVCYTNHALDQFLEGVLKVTNRVARIGGQSKNPQLKDFNIRQLRKIFGRNEDYLRAAVNLKIELQNIQKKIHKLRSTLQIINSRQTVVLDLRFELMRRNIHFKNKDHFKKWILSTRINNNYTEDDNNRYDSDDDYDSDDEYDSDENLVISDSFEVKAKLEELQARFKEFWAMGHVQEDRQILFRIQTQIQFYETNLNYLEFRFNQNLYELPPPAINVRNPEHLSLNQRWALYWDCLADFRQNLIQQIKAFQMDYNMKNNDYTTVQQMEDLTILRDCLVVGMTTTGAAKFRTVLEGLRSPIVIVEEAAEVLEAHIVTSLTPNCKHLILIGDHKQLRPSTSVYHLAKDFNLDISLFERMIKNGMHCHSLGVQHRMRNDFAQLIVPSIYPNLQNHHSVYEYPNIIGMKKNLFFIKHTHFEESIIGDINSKQNNHEAEFILQLCRHLILQGYNTEDITILTLYNGQMFYMKKLQNNIPTIKDVRITVVDNFQGEESNIILLSLVRSNKEGKIGFLASENRICVALSRAKHGFYIIGNMNKLVSNDKSKWPEINNVLEQNKSIGTHLVLQCKIHKDQETYVNCAEDFKQKCPEGGCILPCNLVMSCGHYCESLCHVQDRDHIKTKCLKPCSRIICKREHSCPNLCYKECNKCKIKVEHILTCSHKVTLPCYMDPLEYKCQEIITVKLDCEHENKLPCSDDPKTAICSHRCTTRLNCGHKCEKRCHIHKDPDHEMYECRKPCEQLNTNCSANHKCNKLCYEECNLCHIIVEKKHNTCEHSQRVKCHQNIDEVSCKRMCSKKLNCGHKCFSLCGEQCDQSKCKVQVQKGAPICEHQIEVECGKAPKRIDCKKKCPLKMACGHICNDRCSICAEKGCYTKCKTLVDHSFVVDCNHKFKIPCLKANKTGWKSYSQDLLKYCNNPCNYELECKHPCSGTCGKCYQGRLHQPCNSKCGLTLVCGHPCESPCRENCPPCMKNCQFRCRHSQCKKQCGEICTPCKEPCPWRCKHFICTKRCGDICNRKVCNKPCSKLLKCGHYCIGICGETCPNVCRVCDPENEIFTILFGNEDENTSRFIILEDCGHIFEVNGLEKYFKIFDKDKDMDISIDVLKCPRCRQPVIQTLRYSTLIKEKFRDITNIKKRIFGDPQINMSNAQTLRDIRIPQIKARDNNNLLNKCGLLNVLQNISKHLQPIYEKRQLYKTVKVSGMQLSLFDSQIGIIKLILSHLVEINKLGDEKNKIFAIAIEHARLIATVLDKQYNKLNQQQLNDLMLETKRLARIHELAKLLSSFEYKANGSNSDIVGQQKKVLDSLLSSTKFTLQYDDFVKKNLLDFEKLLKLHGGVSDEIRQEIVRAIQNGGEIRQGAWFKCPKGHYYVIGECGGAMSRGICIECKADIGGSSHKILSTNSHAPEMDGSQPPWPGQ